MSNILIEYGTFMKLVRLIIIYLNETYSKIKTANNLLCGTCSEYSEEEYVLLLLVSNSVLCCLLTHLACEFGTKHKYEHQHMH